MHCDQGWRTGTRGRWRQWQPVHCFSPSGGSIFRSLSDRSLLSSPVNFEFDKRGRASNSPEESVNENILLSLDQNDEELVMLMRIRDSRVRLLLPPLSLLVTIKSSPGSGWQMSEPRRKWNILTTNLRSSTKRCQFHKPQFGGGTNSLCNKG